MSNTLSETVQEIADNLWDKWAMGEEGRKAGCPAMTKDLFTLAIQDILPKQPTEPAQIPQEVKDKIILRGKELFPTPAIGHMNTFIIAAEYGYSLAPSGSNTTNYREVYVEVNVEERLPTVDTRIIAKEKQTGIWVETFGCIIRGYTASYSHWLERRRLAMLIGREEPPQ